MFFILAIVFSMPICLDACSEKLDALKKEIFEYQAIMDKGQFDSFIDDCVQELEILDCVKLLNNQHDNLVLENKYFKALSDYFKSDFRRICAVRTSTNKKSSYFSSYSYIGVMPVENFSLMKDNLYKVIKEISKSDSFNAENELEKTVRVIGKINKKLFNKILSVSNVSKNDTESVLKIKSKINNYRWINGFRSK